MSSQILFLRKNCIDAENALCTLTASESQATVDNVRDRSNRSAFATSGSSDAALTTITVAFGETRRISDILLLKHNFKSYTVQYYDDDALAWANFSTSIAPTTNTLASTYHAFTAVNTTSIRLVINGTVVANAEKYLYQFIAADRIGKLSGWPTFKSPRIGRDIKVNKMLSGRVHVVEAVGFYQTRISVANWSSDADLGIVEDLYDANEGFLFCPAGGDEDQFSSIRQGFRKEDVFLVRCTNEYRPEWVRGLYQSGLKLDIDVTEVLT